MGDSRTIMPIWDAKFKYPLSHDNHGDRTRGHTNYCRRTIIFNQVWDGGGRHAARLARVWHWQRATVARYSHHNGYRLTTPAICRTAAVRLQLSGTSLALEWYEARTNRTIS